MNKTDVANIVYVLVCYLTGYYFGYLNNRKAPK